jgi:hypothetical protein
MRSLAMALALLLCATTAFAIMRRPEDRSPELRMPEPMPKPMPMPDPVPVPEPEPEPRPVPAIPVFECTPDSFTLGVTNGGYHLEGTLEMPTPGFTYAVTGVQELRDGSLRGTLSLTQPEGMALQVIDRLSISHDFPAQELSRLSLRVDRNFNWGPEEISCEMTGMAQ